MIAAFPYHALGNFNPLPSCEGRQTQRRGKDDRDVFQSTPLMRGETVPDMCYIAHTQFQSTPLMRGETTTLF